jgi:hypothetical protein
MQARVFRSGVTNVPKKVCELYITLDSFAQQDTPGKPAAAHFCCNPYVSKKENETASQWLCTVWEP